MAHDEVRQSYRTELEIGAVEIQLIVYAGKLTDRAAVNALITAQAAVLTEFAVDLASQTEEED